MLPPGAKLPDGAEVEVTPLAGRADDPPFLRAILNLAKPRDWPEDFAVMQDHELSEVLTADPHFGQAGFKALLA